MEEGELCRMRLHERKIIHDNIQVMRVMGGWIYTDYQINTVSIFVPEPEQKVSEILLLTGKLRSSGQ